MNGNIPYLFDFWDDPFVHLLLLKSSMVSSVLSDFWNRFFVFSICEFKRWCDAGHSSASKNLPRSRTNSFAHFFSLLSFFPICSFVSQKKCFFFIFHFQFQYVTRQPMDDGYWKKSIFQNLN